MNDRFTMFRSYFEVIEELDDKQRLAMYDAIMRYAFYGELPEDLPPFAKGYFRLMQPTIDASIRRRTANSENGKKGGRPKKATENPTESESKPTEKADMDMDMNMDKDMEEDRKKEMEKAEKKNIDSSAAKPRETEQLFNAFWEAYPKKKDKKNARKAFDKAIKNTNLDTMLAALEKQRTTSDWQRDGGQFIPYPATWLNGERWADDLTDAKEAAFYTERPEHIPDD